MPLNNAQKTAVNQPIDCQLQIIAGPGTGKTKTLTSRVVHFIHDLKIDPQNIIVMTFTNQAAFEMKKRISDMLIELGDEDLAQITMKKLCIGTYHSICYRYLVRYGKKAGQTKIKGIIDDREKKQLIKAIVTDSEFEKYMKNQDYLPCDDTAFGRNWISNRGDQCSMKYYDLMTWISEEKNEQKHREKYFEKSGLSNEILKHIYQRYEKLIEKVQKLDFDDILLKCRQLLEKCPEIVNKIQTVLVDEFQDSSAVQLDLACLFSQEKNSFTLVGDPDQSIYAFRGAIPENFRIILEKYPDCHTVYLEENYRSIEPILHLSSAVICQDINRIGGTQRILIASKKGAKDNHSKPTYLTVKNSYEEREFIECSINYLIKASRNALKYRDFAILCRTKRQASFYGSMNSVPITFLKNKAFWEKPFICTILSYLRVISNIEDRINIEQTLNEPKKGINKSLITQLCLQESSIFQQFGETMAEKFNSIKHRTTKIDGIPEKAFDIITEYYDTIKQWQEFLDGNVTSDTLIQVVNEIGDMLLNPLEKSKTDDSQAALARNQNDLIILTGIIGNSATSAIEDPDYDLFEEIGPLEYFLSTVAMHGEYGKDETETPNSVTVATIHGSKGSEWPVVFLAGMSNFAADSLDEQNEERRVLFVALTRAQLSLTICYSQSSVFFGQMRPTAENSFLKHGDCNGLFDHRMRQIDDISTLEMEKRMKFINRKFERDVEMKDSSKKTPLMPFSAFTSASELLRNERNRGNEGENVMKRRKTKKKTKEKAMDEEGELIVEKNVKKRAKMVKKDGLTAGQEPGMTRKAPEMFTKETEISRKDSSISKQEFGMSKQKSGKIKQELGKSIMELGKIQDLGMSRKEPAMSNEDTEKIKMELRRTEQRPEITKKQSGKTKPPVKKIKKSSKSNSGRQTLICFKRIEK